MFRSRCVALYLNNLKSQGFVLRSIQEISSPKAKLYIFENLEQGKRVTVYHTFNSWVEVSVVPINISK